MQGRNGHMHRNVGMDSSLQAFSAKLRGPGFRTLWFTCVVALTWLLTAAPVLAQDAGHTTVASNVRQGPGLDHRVLRTLPAGTAVTVIGRNANGTWLQLEGGAWIYAQLVTFETDQTGGTVTTVGSNVRRGPSVDYPVQTVLPAGTAVAVVGRNAAGTWLQLADGNWIFAALVTNVPRGLPRVAPDSAPPPAPAPATPPAASGLSPLPDHAALRAFHLQEINALRATHGHTPLALAWGGPAQVHVNELANGGYASHWDRAGLAPYMRYTRWVGDGAGSEIVYFSQVSGLGGRCAADLYDLREWLSGALGKLAGSLGILETLLMPQATTVRIGLAPTCDHLALVYVVGHDLIRWRERPYLDAERVLHLEGEIDRTTRLDSSAYVAVAWEPLPQPVPVHHLLEATGCYTLPRRVAIVARRALAGQTVLFVGSRCPNPWQVESQGRDHIRETYKLPVRQARTWETRVTDFTIALDLRYTISEYGDGVYTISVWGTSGAKKTLLSFYSVVVGDRPDLDW